MHDLLVVFFYIISNGLDLIALCKEIKGLIFMFQAQSSCYIFLCPKMDAKSQAQCMEVGGLWAVCIRFCGSCIINAELKSL